MTLFRSFKLLPGPTKSPLKILSVKLLLQCYQSVHSQCSLVLFREWQTVSCGVSLPRPIHQCVVYYGLQLTKRNLDSIFCYPLVKLNSKFCWCDLRDVMIHSRIAHRRVVAFVIEFCEGAVKIGGQANTKRVNIHNRDH